MENDLPGNTVVRLSQYRRLLEKYKYLDEPYIFSHDLARMLDVKAVQVRHDLMLLGISGDRRKGYSVTALIDKISEKIDRPEQNIILVGLGRLGMSLVKYLKDSNARLDVAAAFDIDPAKINHSCEGISCSSITNLPDYVRQHDTTIAILAIPPEDVNDILPILLDAGIKGILNYTSEHLAVPDNVFVRNVDMLTSLEEIAYFTNS